MNKPTKDFQEFERWQYFAQRNHSDAIDTPTHAIKYEKRRVYRHCRFYGYNNETNIRSTEAFKASCCEDIFFYDCDFMGGVEDAFDAVRGKRYIFEKCNFDSITFGGSITRSKQHMTIKGSVVNVLLKDCHFYGDTLSGFSIKLGDWTDYDYTKGRPPTTGVQIEDCVWHNKDVRQVLSIHAKKPRMFNCKGGKDGIHVPKLLASTFFALRRNHILGPRRSKLLSAATEEPWLPMSVFGVSEQ